jgi:hypothetical protein
MATPEPGLDLHEWEGRFAALELVDSYRAAREMADRVDAAMRSTPATWRTQ